MEVRHASHCTYRIRYHLVLVLKYRKRLITSEIFAYMQKICSGISARYYFYFEALGSDGDHLHIVVECAPKHSPSEVMQICKSILAKQVFKKFPKLREELWGGEFWSDGGHVDSIGDGRGLDEVKKYVSNQGKKSPQLTLFEFVRESPVTK